MHMEHIFSALDQEQGQIRLLHLDTPRCTANGAAPALTGRLDTASLSEPPQYNALSYAWGDPTAVAFVNLDDGSHIPIAANLLDALLNIIVIDSSPIWIDAICMDQSNDNEKSWQVQMMDQIYSRANKTLIYLGPSSTLSGEAIRSFSVYGLRALEGGILDLHNGHDSKNTFEFGYERWTWQPLEPQGDQLINEIIRDIKTPGMRQPLNMLESLMQRPWWSRVWVLQELLLSPNPVFVCGRQSISAKVFVASLRLYEAALTVYCDQLVSEPCEHSVGRFYAKRMMKVTLAFHNMVDVPALVLYNTHLRQIARSRYHGIEEPYFGLGNLWDLVQDIDSSRERLDASDPRDRIYALVGIARLCRVGAAEIRPDYTLSCSDVYARATHFFMQYSGARMLEIAARSRYRSSLSELPSWAVDWSLSELMTTPEPSTDNPEPGRFELTRNATRKNILRSCARLLGEIEVIDIVCPSWENSETGSGRTLEEEALDTITRMLMYLVDANAGYAVRFPTLGQQRNFLKRLTHTVVLHSAPDVLETKSARYTLSEIKGATSILLEQLTIISGLEHHSFRYMRGLAARAFINSCIAIGGLLSSDLPTVDEIDLDLQSNILIFVLECVQKTVYKDAIPFIFNEGLIGIGTHAICNGDTLIEYQKEGLRFVVRPVHGGTYKLIGKACVAQPESEQSEAFRGEVSVISLC